ncbi:NAD(P)-dependent oxidoreductase [uncultured Pigmentiphaga sp.]|jgi:3-hydroxyisobutyrate dehydrogenase and related beta-hydroxyacid dehydrogenases|uniref:NAD(P)-dependent oxidoreductase n=1 Tax=uncultured Pigmentiphaga sp. TaxID=340361 RepID=UPI0026255864|nr:NAD(P)-dependent oxidoreductase [uncultured Pigmentiphaga sp.]
MSSRTIALLHPGAMGAALGACLVSRGHRVLWCSAGRSAASAARAREARLEDALSLEMALGEAEIAISVCPPHNALELAQAVAEHKYGGLFIDANAVSPATAREIEETVRAAGADFVDGGIIGLPPRKPGTTRLYLSGNRAAEAAALFAGSALGAIALDGPPGAASALKICYAAWSKGSTALLAGIRALARHQGVEAALLAEWHQSSPQTPARSEEVAQKAEKAWRWVGEMEEIAATFEAAGLPPGFHLAAADIYRRLDVYKGASEPPSIDEALDKLLR